MFESLLIASADETASAYGPLADDVTMAPDQLSVTFHLRPQARFSNGDPVLASDVKYSYDMLMSKSASPLPQHVRRREGRGGARRAPCASTSSSTTGVAADRRVAAGVLEEVD